MGARMWRLTLTLLLIVTTGCGGELNSDARLQSQQVLQEASTNVAGMRIPEKRLVLCVIALWQSEANDVPGALATAALIDDIEGKAFALVAIAFGQTSSGDQDAAQTAAGDMVGASRSFDQALENATRRRGGLEGAAAAALIAADRAQAGDALGARAWAATRAGDPMLKVGALVGVAVGLLQPTGRLGTRSIEGLFPKVMGTEGLMK